MSGQNCEAAGGLYSTDATADMRGKRRVGNCSVIGTEEPDPRWLSSCVSDMPGNSGRRQCCVLVSESGPRLERRVGVSVCGGTAGSLLSVSQPPQRLGGLTIRADSAVSSIVSGLHNLVKSWSRCLKSPKTASVIVEALDKTHPSYHLEGLQEYLRMHSERLLRQMARGCMRTSGCTAYNSYGPETYIHSFADASGLPVYLARVRHRAQCCRLRVVWLRETRSAGYQGRRDSESSSMRC